MDHTIVFAPTQSKGLKFWVYLFSNQVPTKQLTLEGALNQKQLVQFSKQNLLHDIENKLWIDSFLLQKQHQSSPFQLCFEGCLLLKLHLSLKIKQIS